MGRRPDKAGGGRAAGVDDLARRAAALHQAGRPAEAEPLYREALRLDPDDARLHNDLGVIQQELGRTEAAERSFQAAAARDPGFADPPFNLGLLYLRASRVNEAVACLKRTVTLRPDHGEAVALLAEVFLTQGDLAEGKAAARRAVALRPDHADLQRGMGRMLSKVADWDGALACYERALRLRPGDPSLLAAKASVLGNRGDVEGAYALLAPLLAGDAPHPRAALAFATHSRRLGRQAEALEQVERALARTDLAPDDRKELCFVAGQLHDALHAYDAAFARYAEGNRLAVAGFERPVPWPEADRIVAAFGRERLARAPRASLRSERPVFIVGMPRSGTSLVEQILASHPRIHGAGELHDVARMAASLPGLLRTAAPYPECVEGLTAGAIDTLARWYLDRLAALDPGAERVTDKMPHNFLYLGLIALCLPGARVIHCARDPVDTCLSCYFQDFGGGHPYAYDLAALGRTYRDYRRLMDHWAEVLDLPRLDVSYEALVAEPERLTRELVAFCGVPWDARCLRFYESGRFIRTASRDQANRPVYRSSAGRWRNYARHLGPLLEALGPELAGEPEGA